MKKEEGSFDICIIGAGIVGLATAYQLLKKYPKLKIGIIEKEDQVAKHQTSHNSGVIHSGIYYKPGSLRATNCIRGYNYLLEFLKNNKLPYELCGKVIVAHQPSEIEQLDSIYERGIQNGMKGIRIINSKQIEKHEPFARGIKGIWVPEAGITDYKKVANCIAQLLLEKGVSIFLNQTLKSIEKHSDSISLSTQNKSYSTTKLITCPGLYADKVSLMSLPIIDFQILPFRGEYYKLKKEYQHMVKGLIYPIPDPNFPFLGVHFTKMINGGVEAGPNAVLAFQREGYAKTDFDRKEFVETLSYKGFQKLAKKYWKKGAQELARSYHKGSFVKALKVLIPSITAEHLETGGSGVRAMACKSNGELLDDYLIINDGPITHVANAPSPAATSSLSIGTYIADLI
jgi:L-2-hydroxyglutarate oxidase